MPLTYEIIEPAGFKFDEVTTDSNYVYLNIYDAFGLDGEVDFVVKATANSSLYIYIEQTFNVTCPIECEYCSDANTCEVCYEPYYYKCESITDGEKQLAKGWGVTLIVLTVLLGFSGIYQWKVNVDFWIIVNAIQIARIVTIQNIHVVPGA